ncbi:MAG: alpha/beta hydrolase [Verrucomicrobia bacterium]|nr:alpha/beta hydrolase [Verrucomicrobiota bacterium]
MALSTSNVMPYLLLLLAVLSVAVALLTLLRAPAWVVAWKLAILAGEFGHWLALVPLAVGGAAVWAEDGGMRVAIVVLCAVALAGFLRPVVSAMRVAGPLPSGLRTAFGGAAPAGAVLGWRRLFTGSPRPRARVTTERFAGADGHELLLDLYRPEGPVNPGGPRRPCVVMIHGGGWDGGDRMQLAEWNHWLVARGWIVAAVSYRLAPTWQWPAQRADVLAAMDWLRSRADGLGLDPERFVLFGRSAGGQLATAVGFGANDPAIRGVIALYGPHDMPFAWSVSREDDVLNSLNLMRQYMGGPPDDTRREHYATASGQAMAHAGSPPTLLVHGDPDTLAWVRHSERLAHRLRELGVPHYFLRLPWATHAFDFNPDGPGGQLTAYALEWFLASVGGGRPRS